MIGVKSRFSGTLGGVALEVFSVVLGVLLALAVNDWSADRALQARAHRARAAILAEVRANSAELDSTLATLETAAEGISKLNEAPAGAGPRSGSVDLTLPEFSRSAWQTSQLTDATTRLDFDWLITVAKAYETQALYSELSLDLVRSIAELGTPNRAAVLTRLAGQLGVLLDVHRALSTAYDEILAGEGW